MLYIITPTRYRSRCFKLLTTYLANQDFKGEYKWIVVCDGGWEKYEVPANCTFIRRTPSPNDKLPSICLNYLEGLSHCCLTRGAKVLCMEDDEIYHRHYLSTFDRWLDDHDMVGEGNAHYYQWVYSTYCEVGNVINASLCQTGFKGAAIDYFRTSCSTRPMDDPYIDIDCWYKFEGSKKVHPFAGTTISMKSMWSDNPDHKGYGMGHQKNLGDYDYRQIKLQEWAGEYYCNYLPEPVVKQVMPD